MQQKVNQGGEGKTLRSSVEPACRPEWTIICVGPAIHLTRLVDLLLEVLTVVTFDDGAEELCPLPKRESDSEASKDRTTNMQGLLLQGL